MLDSVTKKRIDDLRNILVGKIPSPQSQVEQITTGLIYKFMYDMDVEAVEMGGVPSFFVDDYEKYSWKHLFDPKLGGADKVQLYSDAIENMYTNPSAPQLFREIFKNSFLPFKDPSTLNMFLKEINEFHYSHPEKLGDAFEYLLSFMGSQGDAGQFRTPRHIIDFIVEIVNPQKNETILDPACGTAGFLISSYKHILTQNTDKKLGDKLNASERKKVGDNLVGYDIAPEMTRLSLVNMYLHQFSSPQIHEYDTLSSEDRWNEYYDVILANPPFFSPTGGIQPHSRFSLKSTRAEILFVDYIIQHLKPSGRAGIVVPEGIIFGRDANYKKLRKILVENDLVGVISLPAGIFYPYSSNKTSILIIDRNANRGRDNIFFCKVKDDGFSLTTNRNPIDQNDLPNVLRDIDSWFKYKTPKNLKSISKSLILEHKNVSLDLKSLIGGSGVEGKFQYVQISSVTSMVKRGITPKYSEEGITVINQRCIRNHRIDFSLARKHSPDREFRNEKFLKNGDVLINSTGVGTLGRVAQYFGDDDVATVDSHVTIVRLDSDRFDLEYFGLAVIGLENEISESGHGSTGQTELSRTVVEEMFIPMPDLHEQREIVSRVKELRSLIVLKQSEIEELVEKMASTISSMYL